MDYKGFILALRKLIYNRLFVPFWVAFIVNAAIVFAMFRFDINAIGERLYEIPLDVEEFVTQHPPKPPPTQTPYIPPVEPTQAQSLPPPSFEPSKEEPEIEVAPKMDSLSQFVRALPKSQPSTKGLHSIQEDFALYDFEEYTLAQKEFVLGNLEMIRALTQRNYRYPPIAARMGVQGMNVIEFDLLPSGDIENLRITQSSGDSNLDENTLKTIEFSFKDYPRPQERTTIRFRAYYQLY